MTATSPGYGRYWPDDDLAPFVEHLYADQAHFVRDFRRLVGSTPAAYARSFVR